MSSLCSPFSVGNAHSSKKNDAFSRLIDCRAAIIRENPGETGWVLTAGWFGPAECQNCGLHHHQLEGHCFTVGRRVRASHGSWEGAAPAELKYEKAKFREWAPTPGQWDIYVPLVAPYGESAACYLLKTALSSVDVLSVFGLQRRLFGMWIS
jgi:hypothetical protein